MVAPHPDDEALGCGGTIARLVAEGVAAHVLIVTGATAQGDFDNWSHHERAFELGIVRKELGLSSVSCLGLDSSSLDVVPKKELVEMFRLFLTSVRPQALFLPWLADAHSDHRIVSQSFQSAAKSFRNPSVKSVLYYETLSETNFSSSRNSDAFVPQLWIDVTSYLDTKVKACLSYQSEFQIHPFPRSETAVRSLAALRGSECGAVAAESFALQRMIIS